MSMWSEKQAHERARAMSEGLATHHVVYIPDEGYDVFSEQQLGMYCSLVFVEATYHDGRLVAEEDA